MSQTDPWKQQQKHSKSSQILLNVRYFQTIVFSFGKVMVLLLHTENLSKALHISTCARRMHTHGPVVIIRMCSCYMTFLCPKTQNRNEFLELEVHSMPVM